MLRRSFLKGLLVSPIIGLSEIKREPQKRICIYTDAVNTTWVQFRGKQCLPGQGVVWNDDGSVSRPNLRFAGVSASEIRGDK